MSIDVRSLLPLATRRRRPKHRARFGEAPAFRPGRQVDVVAATPARALALVALATLRRARRPDLRPGRWTHARFGREVELVRGHLAPVRSRAVLAASFGREAFQGDPLRHEDAPGPVTVAYAIRWLELGDGEARPRWDAWLAESAPRPSVAATTLGTVAGIAD
jgi:hypothetical protein